MIARQTHQKNLGRLLRRNRVVVLQGAPQSGKTTLVKSLLRQRRGTSVYYNLDDPRDQARLSDPLLALENVRGLVVLDGIRHQPDLFSTVRVLTDRPSPKMRFLITGNATPDLLRGTSESLAGHLATYELGGLSPIEVGMGNLEQLWLRGGFPRAYLARSGKDSMQWRRDYMRTLLERDLPQLGVTVSSQTLRRVWSMLGHYHGQTWNASEFARSLGVADTTVRRYLEIFSGVFMLRLLPPWIADLRKRQVKAPKIYVGDSGLLHTTLDLGSKRALEGHPKLGVSWAGFLLDLIIERHEASHEQCYFWATHSGAKLDLLINDGQQRLGFDFQRTATPALGRSLRSAVTDLQLTRLDIIHAGRQTFPLATNVRAVSATRLDKDLPLG